MRKSQSKGKKIQTKLLEEQTRRMQSKLQDLKKQMQLQKSQRDPKMDTGSRWKQSNTNAPLRGYATKLIEDQKTLFKKHGITPTMLATKKFSSTSAKPQSKSQIKTQSKGFVQLATSPSETMQQPVYNLNNRFGQAIMNVHKIQTQESINTFLQNLGLIQYAQVLEQNQIYDVDLLTKELLQEIGIPPGHRIKIMKRIRQSKQGETPLQTNQQTKNQIKSEQQITQKQQQNSRLQQQQQRSQSQTDQNFQQGGKLLQGQYDEQRNAREFQEALLAYRGVYKQIQQIALQTDFFPIQSQSVIQVPSTTATKYACFSCYKTFVNEPYYLNKRPFCSQTCFKKYQVSILQNCPKCRKSFNKLEGFGDKGVRYCSIQCSPDVRKMEQLFIKWRIEDKEQGK